MKKILSILLLLVVLGGSFESKVLAGPDEVPPVMRMFSMMPIDQINHLK